MKMCCYQHICINTHKPSKLYATYINILGNGKFYKEIPKYQMIYLTYHFSCLNINNTCYKQMNL